MIRRILHRPFFIRLLHREYWPFGAVYGWIMPVWAWLGLRSRSLFFFSAANPSIENGGFMMESKKKIYDLLPPGSYPRTLLFSRGTAPEQVLQQVRAAGFGWPLIGKPDIGGKGRGVQKLDSAAALLEYAGASPIDFLVQEYECLPFEAGIFYYRYPGQAKGRISGIVSKELLSVKGTGRHTIRQLLQQRKRYILQLPALEKQYGPGLDEVLPAGLVKELAPYGNHARGARFLDDSHLADERLTASIDALCRQVEGFYFGRLDIRYSSWEELRRGRGFSVIELNGAGAEPTHIYDPRHSLWYVWKEIVRHWIILWRISRLNHRRGVPYLGMRAGVRMLKANRDWEQQTALLYA